MVIHKLDIDKNNDPLLREHKRQFGYFAEGLSEEKLADIKKNLLDFCVAVPSWALGKGGTRFGRFSIGGEPRNLEEKINDVGILQALCGNAGEISLHIPWDVPKDYRTIVAVAEKMGIGFGSVNSNTFQDQKSMDGLSYAHGSLDNVDGAIRQKAVQHNIDVIEIGKQLGSKSLTVWLADGANFPGQKDFYKSLENTQKSLQHIYAHLPKDWKMLIEYKPYEPNFYATTIADWGTSSLLAEGCGDRAFTLVDLGHHLPNTNIEQIVATLFFKRKLGGFHFNDSKYGDDDLTVGSIKPYSLFLIFLELVKGMARGYEATQLEWMIDASHNTKDPMEDLIQSLDALYIALAKALLVDFEALAEAQASSDVARAQELLQDAFLTDVRPLVRQIRLEKGAALDPMLSYRNLKIRERLIDKRGSTTSATGL